MATLGLVPFSGSMATSHGNKLQILAHSEGSVANNNERREIIILRRKHNTPVVEVTKTEPVSNSGSVQSSAGETATATVLVSSSQGKLSKKKPSMNLPRAHHQPPPVAVARRNARERNRVKQVNNGFATLRQHIPLSVSSNYSSDSAGSGSRASRKLSKVETLRMAVDYIRSLQQLLSMDDEGNSETGATSLSISHTQILSPNSASSSSDSSSPSPKVRGGTSPQPSPNSISSSDLRCPPAYCASETIPNDFERTTPSVLIDDDDDDASSFIDPTSPSSSSTLRSSTSTTFTSPPQTQYQYRSVLPRANSLIQVMASNSKEYPITSIGSYAHDGTGFAPLTATTSLKHDAEEYLAASHHALGRLQLHQQLAATVEDTYHPEDLALLSARLHRSPNAPTTASSLSPGVYSEQSLSPETAIASAEISDVGILRPSSTSSTFLPAFSSALSRVSPRASTLHLVTSTASPIQYVSQPAVVTQHEAYAQAAPGGIELLSHVKMEMDEADGNAEDVPRGDEVVIVGGGAEGTDVIDVMSWWEHEQRLHLITAPNSSSLSAPPSS